MFRPIVLTAVLLAPFTYIALPSGQEPAQDHAVKYEALYAAGDHTNAVAFFRENAARALPLIDAHLEGALAKIESGEAKPDDESTLALFAKARFGAKAADEALATVLVGDYAAAFSGWSQEEQARFRGGQKAFGEHRAAMKEQNFEVALTKARECRDLAAPLGDWWGLAMGLGGEGQALLAAGKPEAALAPLARARLLNHELGLEGSELGVLRAFVDAALAAGKHARAEAALEHALALAERRKDEAALNHFRAQRQRLGSR